MKKNFKRNDMSSFSNGNDSLQNSLEDLNDEQNFQIKLTRDK
jgi:hypothetical protein